MDIPLPVSHIVRRLGLTALAALLPAAAAAQVPPGEAAVVPWGISSSAGSVSNYRDWFPVMAKSGVQYVRLFPEWNGLERTKGTWNWDSTDALVKAAADNNLRINGILMGSVPWQKEGSHAFPMKNLPDWSAYVSAVVARYKGKIGYWEVWNEGNGGFNDGHHTTGDYAALSAVAFAAARKADPAAKVGLTVASFDVPYLHEAMLAQKRAGTPDSFDFLCIHPYEIADGVDDPDGEIPWLWMSRGVRDALKSAAPARAGAEIWITEAGRNIAREKDRLKAEQEAAAVLVKLYTMSAAQGIRCVQWFEAQDPPNEEPGFGLIRRDGKPRRALDAFAAMTGVLGASPEYLGWLALGEGGRAYGFVFQGSKEPVLVAWIPAGMKGPPITLPGQVQVTDCFGNAPAAFKPGIPFALTEAPVFVTGLPQNLIVLARANAAKSFPWGGDFSGANAVSVQPGSAGAHRGMFQTSPDSTPSIKFADGSTGILVRGDQAVNFYVHPSFATFLTREYYVRLTVRRIGPGNAGMNLFYETADSQGRSPYRNTEQWFSLSPENEWQTHTWKISGACLSRMWGYDISFRPEQSQPFVIGKVEVSTQPF